MEAVLISINSKWCEKILNLEKVAEIRKRKPSIKQPFKCYIYCTKPKFPHEDHIVVFSRDGQQPKAFYGGGKVIAEFICNDIETLCKKNRNGTYSHKIVDRHAIEKYAAMSMKDFWSYVKTGPAYAWHISEVVVYEEPKELSDFRKICPHNLYCESCAMYDNYSDNCGNEALIMKKAPQSWCYVEEING